MADNQVHLSVANFAPNSFITIEDKKDNDYFFIIRQGKIKISKSINSLLGESDQILGPGDFFGVIGAMTGHPRIESSIASAPTSLIVVKKNQFGLLIQKNAPLAMKIIRGFSKNLRHFDIELAKRTTKGTHDENNPDNLYHVGMYYHKINKKKISAYIFMRYMKLFPQGAFIEDSREKLEELHNVQLSNAPDSQAFNRVYQDEEMLFSEFEPGEHLFIIQSGKIKITKIISNQEVLIAVLNPGDILGEMAILDNKNRAASAIAFEEVKVMAVNRANFEKVVVKNAAMATKLITLLSDRIWTVYRQLANLLLEDPFSRLYDTLLTQMMRNHVPIEHKKHYHFSIGPDELLKMVGIEGQVGKQAIKQMMDKRYMNLKNQKIYCEDVLEIKKEVDFARRMQEREFKLRKSKRQYGTHA